MSVLLLILLLALQGLLIGAFARLALPGKDPLTVFQTMAVGIAGSLLAGIVFYLIFGDAGRSRVPRRARLLGPDHVLHPPLARRRADAAERRRAAPPRLLSIVQRRFTVACSLRDGHERSALRAWPVGALLCILSAAGFGAMAIFGKLAYDEGVEVGELLFLRFALAAPR